MGKALLDILQWLAFTFLRACPFGLVAAGFSCRIAGNTCPNFMIKKTKQLLMYPILYIE